MLYVCSLLCRELLLLLRVVWLTLSSQKMKTTTFFLAGLNPRSLLCAALLLGKGSILKLIINTHAIMLLQATIVRHYFVKTQTSVASFGPPDLSIIF